MKKIGILHPIFCLENKYGIGSFGKEAYAFVDFLFKAKIDYWQILPLAPTSYGDSPYQALSTYAGSINYIDLEALLSDGLISEEDLNAAEIVSEKCEYGFLFSTRIKILRKAYHNFLLKPQKEFNEFKKMNAYWLDDYALYMSLKTYFNYQALSGFPKPYYDKSSYEVKIFKMEHSDDLDFHKFNQFLFFKEWYALKLYANKRNIKIIGDMPIYVATDSSDVFASPDVFLLDERMQPKSCAGVPPDYFSEDGQLWGNPIYNYDFLRKTNYDWMLKRIKHHLAMYDIIRLDHFRGYASYYVIPSGMTNAKIGSWEVGPRMELFKKVKRLTKGPLRKRIIAEDLGFLTDDVTKLLKDCKLAGMKVMQFGYPDCAKSTNYYQNYTKYQTVYPGTHDNDTIRGWFNHLDIDAKEIILKDLKTNEDNLVDDFIKAILNSKSQNVVILLTDFMNLDSSFRINTPGEVKNNWCLRIKNSELNDELINHILKLTQK